MVPTAVTESSESQIVEYCPIPQRVRAAVKTNPVYFLAAATVIGFLVGRAIKASFSSGGPEYDD